MAGTNYLSPEHSLPNAAENTIISLEVSILTTHKTSYHQWIQKRLLQCVKPFVYFFVAYEEYSK